MSTTGSYTPTSIAGTLSHLLATMTQLGKQVNRLEQNLVSLETPPPTAKAPSASPSAPANPKPSRAKPMKKEKAKAPTRGAGPSVYPHNHPIQSHPRENDHHPVYYG